MKMTDQSSTAFGMEQDHSDRVLSPRAALFVCAAAALLGWLGVAGAVYVGKSLIGEWRDMDVAGRSMSTIAPASGPRQPGAR